MRSPPPLRARYSKIESLVDSILSDAGVTRTPVPIDNIVRAAGITLTKGNLGDVSGLLVRSDGRVIIGVNERHSLGRRRFTVAHEYGHYLLHEGIQRHVDRDFRINYRSIESSQATNVEEIEANFFAANILMPKKFLLSHQAIDHLDSDEGVSELAEEFLVSRHAMSLRLANVFGDHRPF